MRGNGGYGGEPGSGRSDSDTWYHGSPGQGGQGGDATASAVAMGSSQVEVNATATAGSGGNYSIPYSPDTEGAPGNASATVQGIGTTPESEVRGRVSAVAGAGGSAYIGGVLSGGQYVALDAHVEGSTITLGPLFAESTSGGTAVAGVEVIGSAGGGVVGSSVTLDNVVDGATTGSLTLGQRAQGGDGRSTHDWAPGAGGAATSALHKDIVAARANLGSSAIGGKGGSTYFKTAGDGGSATASAWGTNTGDLNVSAYAQGGDGGESQGLDYEDAGDGGSASLGLVYGASTNGGNVAVFGTAIGGKGGATNNDGGRSGHGADAALINAIDGETVGGSLSLYQTATGGNAGQSSNGPSGHAGSATSTLTKSGSYSYLTVTNQAKGGNGPCGWPYAPASGGHATAETIAVNLTGSVDATAHATGGNGCGVSSIASASAIAKGRDDVSISVSALGGLSGLGTDGGEALLGQVYGESTAGGLVNVFANVVGGTGGYGGDTTANGRSVSLVNAINGSTTGELRLFQQVLAGDSGGPGGQAGNATSSLTKSGSFARLSLGANSLAGSGGRGDSSHVAAVGGTATALLDGTAAGDVDIQASASGGKGGSANPGFQTGLGLVAGTGGQAVLQKVFGASTGGGSVQVSGSARGGSGGSASKEAQSGDGASVVLVNAVDGETTGFLALAQHAMSGSAGDVEEGVAGTAGNVTNHLEKSGSYEQLSLELRSLAGRGVCRSKGPLTGGMGGSSDIHAAATNTTGDVIVDVYGDGGQGGCGGGVAGAMHLSAIGTAAGSVDVSVFGDAGSGGSGGYQTGASIVDGAAGGSITFGPVFGHSTAGREVTVSLTAMGGEGGYAGSSGGKAGDGASMLLSNVIDGETSGALTLRQAAEGGSAGFVGSSSALNGTAGAGSSYLSRVGSFDSLVLEATARGGGGSSRNGTAVAASAGANGTATSVASNVTGSAVANATADGGSAGYSNAIKKYAEAGRADAHASAYAATSATARASATGGYSDSGGQAEAYADAHGSGIGNLVGADASSVGGSGVADAQADTAGGLVTSARSSATASLLATATTFESGQAAARAVVGEPINGAADPFAGVLGREAVAVLVAQPAEALVESALEGNTTVQEALAAANANPLMLGALGGAYALDDFGEADFGGGQTIVSTSVFAAEFAFGPMDGQQLILGLLDPEASGQGFSSLRFRVFNDGVSVLDQSFNESSEALNFFNDNALNLGALTVSPNGRLSLMMQIDLTGNTVGEGFYFDVLAATSAVPAPPTLWLLITGIGALVTRRHLRRH